MSEPEFSGLKDFQDRLLVDCWQVVGMMHNLIEKFLAFFKKTYKSY